MNEDLYPVLVSDLKEKIEADLEALEYILEYDSDRAGTPEFAEAIKVVREAVESIT